MFKILKKYTNLIIFWFNNARGYSIPMSVMSWIVPFLYAYFNGGNLLIGFLDLIGIAFTQAGVNLLDDVIDYYQENKLINMGVKDTFNFQKRKCAYIINNQTTWYTTVLVTFFCFALALLIGAIVTLYTGWQLLIIIFITAILCISYSFLGRYALGEVVIGIVFAPLLYIGVYFSMTQSLSLQILLLSVSTGLLTIGLSHSHMFLDFKFDSENNKKTLCTLLKTEENALKLQALIMIIAYLNILVCVYLKYLSLIYLITFITIPTAMSLYKTYRIHINNPNQKIKRTFVMGYMENWENILKNGTENFMIKFLLARNVMIHFTVMLSIAIILSKGFNI